MCERGAQTSRERKADTSDVEDGIAAIAKR